MLCQYHLVSDNIPIKKYWYKGFLVLVALFLDIKNDIIRLISVNRNDGEFDLDILMIAKYLERIGDHATNIAETVIYSITGKTNFKYE